MSWCRSFLAVVILSAVCLSSCTDRKGEAVNLVNKADRAFTRGNTGTASSLYRLALRSDPRNGKAYLGLAKAEAKKHHPEQVEWAALRAMDLVNDSRQSLECYVLLGDAYLDLHPDESAYIDAVGRMASEVLKLDPVSADGHRQWAEVANIRASRNAADAEHWREKAINEFEHADYLRKDDFRIQSGLAAALVSAGRLEQAETIYRRLRVARPNDATPELALAHLALARNDHNGAAVIIRGIVSHGRADLRTLTAFCREAIALGWFNDVLPIISYLEQHGADSTAVSEFYTGSNQRERAISFLESRIAHAKPSAASSDYALLGQTFIDCGLAERAVAVARECLSRDPKSSACQAIELYESAWSSGEAYDVERLERLRGTSPGEPLAHLYLGKVYQKARHFELARIEYNRGLRDYPDRLDLKLARARVELELQEMRLARSDALDVLKKYPANRQALEVIAEIPNF